MLGIFFSEVRWDHRIDNVRTKLYRISGRLNQRRHHIPTLIKEKLYNAFFLSTITSCHLVWGTTSPQNNKKLAIAQECGQTYLKCPTVISCNRVFCKIVNAKASFLVQPETCI